MLERLLIISALASLTTLWACGSRGQPLAQPDPLPDDQPASGGAENENETDATGGNPELRAIQSEVNYTLTVSRLADAIRTRGLGIISVVDHAEGATGAGLDLRPTTLFIFGNPSAGTPLMQDNPTLALDFPQRMLVYSLPTGETFVVWRPPSVAAIDHGVEADHRLSGMNQLLEELAGMATGPEPGGGAPR